MKHIKSVKAGLGAFCCGVIGILSVYGYVQRKPIDTPLPVLQVHGDSILYGTLSNLEQSADIIALVRPIGLFLDREHVNTFYSDGTIQDFYTKSQVAVEKVFKDDRGAIGTKKIFTIIEPVGLVKQKDKKLKLQVEGYNETEYGKSYLVFLKSNGMGGYSIINMNNGKILSNKLQEKANDVEEVTSSGLKVRDEIRRKYKM
ncbi:hypothetical protein [Deinococcus sp.]|uniref:hypothetical protein n=1 Tax=Deinococcus sp. TaxID=47478 RepID=UPI003B59E373